MAVSVNQSAKQSYSNSTNSSETHAAHMRMNDSYCEPAEHEQSTYNWLEYVPQQESSPAVSSPAEFDSKTHSCPQQMLKNPDDGKPYDTPSQPNTHLEQSCVHGVNTNKPKYRVQEPSVCLATGDIRTTNEGTPSQPHNADAHTDKPTYRPLASLLSQATGDTRTTINGVSHQRNVRLLQPHKVYDNTNKPKTPVQSLFASDMTGDTRLTVEDIYIEAMTLDAEIRINRRHLDDRGKAQLSKIMEFCRDALRAKLVLNSMAKRAHERKRQHK